MSLAKKEESPLKPMPFCELFQMLKVRKQTESNHDHSSEDILALDEAAASIKDEPNYRTSNEYLNNTHKPHDLYTIKENVCSFANDSGYSSTTNRTNSSTGFHEVSARKSEFLTPANKPRSNALTSGFKRSNLSRFESFVAPSSTKTDQNRVLFTNKTQLNTVEKEKVVFQYTPPVKVQDSKSTLVKKPVLIPPVQSANNSGAKTKESDGSLRNINDSLCGNYELIVIKGCKYIKGRLIGRGGSCEVYHGFDPVQKVSRAIKIVNLKQSGDTAALYRNEVELLQSLQQSGRIVKLYDHEVVDSDGLLYLVLEMGGKDIDKILKQLSANTCNLPVYKLLYYWMEMLYCVRDIHNIGIVHSDLKPANFLMAESGIKLIDFGIASHLQTDMTSVVRNSAVGSLNYISPEALRCDHITSKYKVNFKSDIWSLGCILYELVYKKAPFHHIRQMCRKMEAITNCKYQIEYPIQNWIPQKILGTIQKCLQFDANLRPTINELISEYDNCNFN